MRPGTWNILTVSKKIDSLIYIKKETPKKYIGFLNPFTRKIPSRRYGNNVLNSSTINLLIRHFD